MRNQKIADKVNGTIELTSETLFYQSTFTAEEPKDADQLSLGWEMIDRCYEVLTTRSAITSMGIEFHDTEEKYHDLDHDKWKVWLTVKAAANDISLFFRKEEDARKMFTTLRNWWSTGKTE